MTYQHRTQIKSDVTVFGIVEWLHEFDGAGATLIANEMGMSKSTIHDHLRTLNELGLVVEEDGEYHLGLKFLQYGMTARQNRPLQDVSHQVLESVADETGEAVWLVVEENGLGVYIDHAHGETGVGTRGEIGNQIHLNTSATGKAILAQLSDNSFEKVVERHGLQRETENTIVDIDELEQELEDIREKGVAFNDEESVIGLRSVAAPIQTEGEVLGAIGISGPARRFQGIRYEENLPEMALKAANELELRVTYKS